MPKRWWLLCAALVPTVWQVWAAPRPKAANPILKSIESNPFALVNITAADMPASPDVLQLGRRSTRALSRCLADNPDAGLRADCAAMLGTLGDKTALPTLHVALEDWEAEVRLRVIQALGQLADAQSTRPLMAAWSRGDESSDNKRAILQSLGALGSPPAIAFLRKVLRDGEHKPVAFAALWRCRHLVSRSLLVEEVARALDSDDDALQLAAALKAAELRDRKLVTPLLALIEDSNANLRNKSIRALGLIGDQRAEPKLLALLPKVRDARLLNNLAFALERIDRPAFFREVKRLITHKQAVIRMNAAFVVGDVQRPEGAPLLEGALRDASDRVRLEAAEAAAKLPGAEPLLLQALKDADPAVRRIAVRASKGLMLLGQALRDSDDEVRREAISVAGARPSPPPSLLIGALADSDQEVRRRALGAIAQHKLTTAVPAVEPLLADAGAPLYEEAVYTLHAVQGKNDLVFDRLFQSRDEARRHRAALTLARLGDARVHDYAVGCLFANRCGLADVEPLLRTESDASVIRRLQLVWARQHPQWESLGSLMVKLRPPGTQALALADLELRSDDDRAGVLRSVELLVQLGETAARPQVAARRDGANAWQRMRLELSLGRLGDGGAAARVAGMLDELPVDWLPDAVSLLGDVGDAGQRAALSTELARRESQGDARLSLAAAAVKLAWQPAVLPARLVDGLTAAHPRERELARRYLREASAETLQWTAARERRREVREELERLSQK